MLPSTCSREALVACPPCPPWNLPSFTVDSILPTPCSRSNPPHSCQGAALAHLDSLPPHDLVLWTDGSVPFPFGKSSSGVLANCSLCGTEATLVFSAGPVCSSFSAEDCAILYALLVLVATTSVPFLFSYYLTLVLSSPLCSLLHLSSYLKLCGRSDRNCLLPSSVLFDYNGSPDTRFSGNDAADKLARRGALLAPSVILCSLSRFISRIHSRLISDWRRTVSSKFFDTQVPSISTEELVLPRHARCVLSRLRCLLLGSYLSRIGRIENHFCNACRPSSQDTSHLILHCPGTDSLHRSLFGDSLSFYNLWSSPWKVARLLGLHGLYPSLGKGRVNNNNRYQTGL